MTKKRWRDPIGAKPPKPGPPKAPKYYACIRCAEPVPAPHPVDCATCGEPGIWIALTMETQSIDEIRRLLKSGADDGPRFSAFRARWIGTFFDYTAKLADPATEVSDEVLFLFWIRLHGVLVDLRDAMKLSFFGDVPVAAAQRHPDPDYRRHALATRIARGAIEQIGGALSREQHIYADWRRQIECHVRQSAYSIQMKSKDSNLYAKEAYVLASLGDEKPISVDERKAARTSVLLAHDDDDLKVARTIARAILEPAKMLLTASQDLP